MNLSSTSREELFSYSVKNVDFESGYSVELGWICLEEYASHFLIIGLPELTSISSCLFIDRETSQGRIIEFESAPRHSQPISTRLFSLFMGLFLFRERYFLLFADKVRPVQIFCGLGAFEVESAGEIALGPLSEQKETSKLSSLLTEKGLFFSYQVDLTKPFCKTSVRGSSYFCPNWLFWSNREILLAATGPEPGQWAVPLVMGNISSMKVPLGTGKRGQLYLLLKYSILDILEVEDNDQSTQFLLGTNRLISLDGLFEIEGESPTQVPTHKKKMKGVSNIISRKRTQITSNWFPKPVSRDPDSNLARYTTRGRVRGIPEDVSRGNSKEVDRPIAASNSISPNKETPKEKAKDPVNGSNKYVSRSPEKSSTRNLTKDLTIIMAQEEEIRECLLEFSGETYAVSAVFAELPGERQSFGEKLARLAELLVKRLNSSCSLMDLSGLDTKAFVDAFDPLQPKDLVLAQEVDPDLIGQLFLDSLEGVVSQNLQPPPLLSFAGRTINEKLMTLVPSLLAFFITRVRQTLDWAPKEAAERLSYYVNNFKNAVEEFRNKRSSLANICAYFRRQKNEGLILRTDKLAMSFFFGRSESKYIIQEKMMSASQEMMQSLFSNFSPMFDRLARSCAPELKQKLFSPDSIRVAIITHNCSGFQPSFAADRNKFGYGSHSNLHESHILIICLQEIVAMKTKNIKNILLESTEESFVTWRNFYAQLFPKFYIVFNKNLLGLAMIVMVKKNLRDFDFQVHESEFLRLGAFHMANKGSIVIRTSLNFQPLNFLCCHLTSGISESALEKRCEDLIKISKLLENEKDKLSFIVGDLNFRAQMELSLAEELKRQVETDDGALHILPKPKLDEFLQFDELLRVLKRPEFVDFSELPIKFLPTYRFYQFTSEYDLAEGKRIPSWTDRILMFGDNSFVNSPIYYADYETNFSDHKPLFCIFELAVKHINSKPASEQLFSKFPVSFFD